MNTDETVQFLHGPLAGALGTAGAQNRPSFTRLFGARATAGEHTIRVFLPEHLAGQPLADLKENPKAAVTFVDISNFKTRQFKGTITAIEPANAADLERIAQTDQTSSHFIEMYFGPGAGQGWRQFRTTPALALELTCSQAFEQTPGPQAGQEIRP